MANVALTKARRPSNLFPPLLIDVLRKFLDCRTRKNLLCFPHVPLMQQVMSDAPPFPWHRRGETEIEELKPLEPFHPLV